MEKKKGLFKKMVDKLDSSLKEKADKKCCCCEPCQDNDEEKKKSEA